MTSLPRLESFYFLKPENYTAVNPAPTSSPPPPPPEKETVWESDEDEERIKAVAKPRPRLGAIPLGATVLIGQMDPTIAQNIQLTPSQNGDSPYQATLGRNSLHFSTSLLAFIKNENPNKIRTENLRQRFEPLSLSEQWNEFITSQLLTRPQLRKRWQIAVDLLMILRRNYPPCDLFVFGSLLTGLANASSDIDIYMDLKGDEGRYLDKRLSMKNMIIYELQDNIKKILETAKCPHNSAEQFAEDPELIGTRVPIVRFKHVQTGINIDLSFGNRISVRNSNLLIFYMNYDPRVKPLILFLRNWADFHKISGSQKFKKYALSLMALVYLTRKKIIPPVNLLQTLAAARWLPDENPDKVEGWDCSFSTNMEMISIAFEKLPLPENYENVKGRVLLEMIQEFLEMMMDTEFDKVIVCPLLGIMLPRKNIIELDLAKETLPAKLKEFRLDYGSERSFCQDMRIFKPMVIQDPFVLDFNVAGLVNQLTLESFLEACESTVKILKEGPASILDLFPTPFPVTTNVK